MKQSRIIAVALALCALSADTTPASQAEPTPQRRARHALELRMDAATIRAGLKSYDRALHIKAGWIRDPYIMLAPDGYYYLTGTTPNPDEPREQSDPYNTGLGGGSIVGYHLRIWRSKDLVSWEYLVLCQLLILG